MEPTPKNSFQYQAEMPPYSISIQTDSTSLAIIISQSQELPRKKYKATFTLNQLTEISKWFILFDSIDNIAKEIIFQITENKSNIKEDNNQLILDLSIKSRQIKSIQLILPLFTQLQSNELVNDICQSLSQMQKVLQSHTALFSKMSLIPSFKTILSNESSSPYHNGILLTDAIESLIKDSISTTASEIKYSLLYSATVDGVDPMKFHSACDNIHPTLVIIKTTRDIVFGGYTDQTWERTKKYKEDSKAFLFSENKQLVYPIMNSLNAIQCNENACPNFGKGDIVLSKNYLKGKKSTTQITSYEGINNNVDKHQLNNGNKKFMVKELEVYHVKFKENE